MHPLTELTPWIHTSDPPVLHVQLSFRIFSPLNVDTGTTIPSNTGGKEAKRGGGASIFIIYGCCAEASSHPVLPRHIRKLGRGDVAP